MTARSCGCHGRWLWWWPKVHSRMIIHHHHRALLSSSSSNTRRRSGLDNKTSTASCWQRTAVQVKNTTDFNNNNNPYLDAIRQTHDPVQHVKTIEEELKGTIGRALGKQGEKVLRAVRSMQEEFREYERLTSLLLLPQQQRAEQQQEEDGATTTKAISHNNEKNLIEALLHETVERYNQYRDQAVTARWELTVHRQAAGCIVGNHQYVQNAYPIGAKLVVPPDLLLLLLGHNSGAADGRGSGTANGTSSIGDNNHCQTTTTTTTTTTQQQQHGGGEETKKKKFTDQLDWWQTIGRWK